jgi:peptidoglycan-N-acetylglucosamine deacetylase
MPGLKNSRLPLRLSGLAAALTIGAGAALAQIAPSQPAQAAGAAQDAPAPKPKPKAKRAAAVAPAAVAPAAAAVADDKPCGASSIGLSRTVEIDATNGLRYGHQQYKELDFLKDGEIVLTFDDGPSSIYTPRVIEALNFHCTKATFFMVGSRAMAEQKMVQDIARRGHTIATHTWSHANLRNIGFDRAKPEFELGFSGVAKALGRPIAPFFRFPYLADSRAMMAYAKTRHMAMFSIDMDAYDYKTLQPAAVHKAIVQQAQTLRKGIILMHDIQPATAGALKGLLTELKAKGFKIVHMVAKGDAQTLSPYDLQATQAHAMKTMAAQANPLVTRAATYGHPGSSPVPALPGPATGAATTTAGSPTLSAPWKSPNGQGYGLPGQTGSVAPPATAAQQAPAPSPSRRSDDDWRNRVLKN